MSSYNFAAVPELVPVYRPMPAQPSSNQPAQAIKVQQQPRLWTTSAVSVLMPSETRWKQMAVLLE